MPEYTVEGPELKKLMVLAKKGPLPFAFNPGKTDDEHYFAMHRKRDAAILGKVAKKEGPSGKAAYGTCKVEGSVLWLTCTVPVPGIAKKLKKFLKANKVSLAVKVMAADGSMLEDDGEAPDAPPRGTGPVDGAQADGGQIDGTPEDGTPEDGSPSTTKPEATKEEMGDRMTQMQLELRDLMGDAAKSLLGEVESAMSVLAYQGEEAIRATLDNLEKTFDDARAQAAREQAAAEAELAKVRDKLESIGQSMREIGSTGAQRVLQQVDYVTSKLSLPALESLKQAIAKVEQAARDVMPDDGAPGAPQATTRSDAPQDPAQAHEDARDDDGNEGDAQQEASSAKKERTKEDLTTDLTELQARLREMVGDGARALLSEVESAVSTATYQSQEALQAATEQFEQAFAQAEAESKQAAEQASRELDEMKERLGKVMSGIGQLTGPMVTRLTRQADYLADKIGKQVLDGVSDAMTALEGALRDVLPDDAPAPEPQQAEEVEGNDPPQDTAADGGPDGDNEDGNDEKDAIAAIAARLKALGGQIAALQPEAKAKVQAAFNAVVARAKAKDIPGAEEGIAKIEAALARLGAAAPAPPDGTLDKLWGAFEAIKTKVEAAGNEAVTTFQQQMGEIEEQIKSASVETAVAGLKAVQDALQSVGEAMGLGDEAAAFVSSSQAWKQTRTQLAAEIGKLETAIRAACGDDPELAEVVSKTEQLYRYVDVLDARLDTKLSEIGAAPDGTDVEPLKAEARQLLALYEAELQKPFFAEVDAGNGFVPINVAAQARSALTEISATLNG